MIFDTYKECLDITCADLSMRSGLKTHSATPEIKSPSLHMDKRRQAVQQNSTGSIVARRRDENICKIKFQS